MDLVTEVGQLNAELRCHHAGTAVGGITCDPNAHETFFESLSLQISIELAATLWTRREGWKMQQVSDLAKFRGFAAHPDGDPAAASAAKETSSTEGNSLITAKA